MYSGHPQLGSDSDKLGVIHTSAHKFHTSLNFKFPSWLVFCPHPEFTERDTHEHTHNWKNLRNFPIHSWLNSIEESNFEIRLERTTSSTQLRCEERSIAVPSMECSNQPPTPSTIRSFIVRTFGLYLSFFHPERRKTVLGWIEVAILPTEHY